MLGTTTSTVESLVVLAINDYLGFERFTGFQTVRAFFNMSSHTHSRRSTEHKGLVYNWLKGLGGAWRELRYGQTIMTALVKRT